MKSLCETCKDITCCAFTLECGECLDYERQTNANRIRAMSDEEMARWIAKHAGQTCPRDDRDCVPTCEQCWLEWLQEESDKYD